MDLKEKQIIYIDNKPHIKCNVVMLPTKNESSLWINCENKLKIHIKDRMCPGKQEFQHLYITSNGKLNKDEWYCSPIGIVSRYNGIEKLPSNWRKIIATTDTSLISSKLFPVGEELHSITNYLPQIPQQFIQQYIEEYNKDNQITEVLVEIEEIKHYSGSVDSLDVDDDYDYIEYKLKLDSQNQITIREQKDSWSKEEHIKAIKDVITEAIVYPEKFVTGICLDASKLNKWIEENL